MAQAKRFSELSVLSPETLEVINSLNFKFCTPVQETTIPLFCGHKDVAVDACTGSGKTLAFIIPVIERLRKVEEKLHVNQVGAIVIVPTRELAKQVFKVAEPFVSSVPGLKCLLLTGGRSVSQDVSEFKSRGGHVIVGTPGRIDDVMKRCLTMSLKSFEVLVLDEADRLLEMGFQRQLDSIMSKLPKQRRTGLFSATQTDAVQALMRAGLRNPVRVNIRVALATRGDGMGGPEKADGAGKKRKHVEVADEEEEEEEEEEEKDDDPSNSAGTMKKKAKSSKDDSSSSDTASNNSRDKNNSKDKNNLNAALEEAERLVPVTDQRTPLGLKIHFSSCDSDEKLLQLLRFLHLYGRTEKVLVYFLTCASVDYFAHVIKEANLLTNIAFPGTKHHNTGGSNSSSNSSTGEKDANDGEGEIRGKEEVREQVKRMKASQVADKTNNKKNANKNTSDSSSLSSSPPAPPPPLNVIALHGKLKQAAREAAMEAFGSLSSGVLLATDLAARGLDIPSVSWVLQYDAPQDPSAFVHRCGRTARMGQSGNAWALLLPQEGSLYPPFLRMRKIPIEEKEPLQFLSNALHFDIDSKAEETNEVMTRDPKDKDTKNIVKNDAKKDERTNPIENTVSSSSPSSPPFPPPSDSDTESSRVLRTLRALSETDREAMEKGVSAFVSFIRGYKEHHCKFIFKLNDLDIGKLARSFGLLRIPKVGDLRKPKGLEGFEPSEVDPTTVRFRDKQREKQRIQNLKTRGEQVTLRKQEQSAKEAALLKQKKNGGVMGRAGGMTNKMIEKAAVAAAVAAGQVAPTAGCRLTADKRRKLQKKEEMDDLNDEYALLKKLKKGKISQKEYDKRTGILSDGDDDDDDDDDGDDGDDAGDSE